MTLAQGQLLVSILGIVLATCAAVIAWRTFLRSERWKQAEFLAGVMKELAQDERTQRALSTIDWGLRSIKLGESTDPDGGYVKVSRQMQTLALRPHCLLGQGLTAPESIRFTPEEAAIRDCYDSLFDRSERLSNYAKKADHHR
jgi:hypothetical protein